MTHYELKRVSLPEPDTNAELFNAPPITAKDFKPSVRIKHVFKRKAPGGKVFVRVMSDFNIRCVDEAHREELVACLVKAGFEINE